MTKYILQLIEDCGPHCVGYNYRKDGTAFCSLYDVDNPTIEKCFLPEYDKLEKLQ